MENKKLKNETESLKEEIVKKKNIIYLKNFKNHFFKKK